MMDQKLFMLMRRRDRAESRMRNASASRNRYNNPSIHEYDRDVAEEMIQNRLDDLDLKSERGEISE